jgi:hypothetical protein
MVGGIATTSSLMFCFKSCVVLGFFPYTLLFRYPQRISQTQTVWLQQDGATARTVGIAMGVLNEMFPARVISRRGNSEWPARSPDLNACDFFLWGYFKSKVYEKKPRSLED